MSVFDTIFLSASKNYVRVIRVFQIFYFIMFVVSLAAGRAVYLKNASYPYAYTFAAYAGRVALVFLVLATLPGIARRFGIKHKLFVLLSMFRRHLGITTYVFVYIHVSVMLFVPLLAGQKLNLATRTAFELFGMGAHTILFFMFLTSNDVSTKRLGIWWNRLHSMVYLALWFAFFHTYLQRVSIWSVLIGTTAIAEVCSFAFQYYKRRSYSVPPTPEKQSP